MNPAASQILTAAASDLAPLESGLKKLASNQGLPEVRFIFGSSGQIATQIRAGAPYDVYLSADRGIVKSLAESKHVLADSIMEYAQGRLGIWSRDSQVRRMEDVAGAGIYHIAIANPAHAPYGVAAKQALQKSGVWDRVEKRVVYAENVRQALQFGLSGNAEVAVVAWSLVKDRGGVLVDSSLHAPVIQAAAVVAVSKQRDAARRFVRALVSPAGRTLLEEGGFTIPANKSRR